MIQKLLIKYCDLDEDDKMVLCAMFVSWVIIIGTLSIFYLVTMQKDFLYSLNVVFAMPIFILLVYRIGILLYKIVNKIICKGI